MRPDPDEAGLRRYLLGLLRESEAEALEEAYLGRAEVWEHLRGVEDDLLDDYAADRLDPGEKAAFESRYLISPVLRERVVAARALRLTASDTRVPARAVATRRAQWVGLVAIAAGILAALMVLPSWPRGSPQVTSVSAPPTAPPTLDTPQHPPSTGSAATQPSPPRRAPARSPLVLALSPVLLRGQQQPVELRIPPETSTVVLELEGDPTILPPAPAALEARLTTVEGTQVWRAEAGRVTGGRPSLLASASVPAARLEANDYVLTLSTRNNVDGTLYRYFFRVDR